MVSVPDRLQLSAENISLSGVYLMDRGDTLILYLGKVTSQFFCEKVRPFLRAERLYNNPPPYLCPLIPKSHAPGSGV